ncbi:MAG: hypothetical protein PHN48_00230 [Parabacteroides sp.]|nr:hypothetical protein [Parabacteroides sp.]
MIREYESMKRERQILLSQMNSIGFTEEDVIASMCFSHPDGERVQSSELSDKTAKVAISFRERQRKMNEDFFSYLLKQYEHLDEEIIFLEEAIRRLPGKEGEIMQALVLEGMTWDELEVSKYLNRRTISDYRRKAIDSLVREYQLRESQVAAYLLS